MSTPVREWATFEHPDDGTRWEIDVTFLTSGWQCLFGCGCQGVLTAPAPEMEQGCCSYGAHTTDDARSRYYSRVCDDDDNSLIPSVSSDASRLSFNSLITYWPSMLHHLSQS